jgi:hypothetical protein
MTGESPVTLFDQFQREEPGPFPYSASSFDFLNRVAGERWSSVRELLEDWFREYPDDTPADKSKTKLRKAFRKGDEGQHLGAWWELYIYTLYRRLGYLVTVHPEVPGIPTRPDFLVTSGASSMYVECTVVSATDGPITQNPAIEAAIYDAINTVTNRNFLIALTIKHEGTEQPRVRSIVGQLESWLESLDPDEVLADIESATERGELAVAPELDLHVRDWVLTCKAWPNAPDKRYDGGRLLGSLPASAAFIVKNVERIYKAVKDKGGHYGELGALDKPLAVAVLSVNNFAGEEDVTDAMFGNKAIRFIPGDRTSVQPYRKSDGYWRGPDSDRGARVSAVLFSHDMRPWSIASHLPSVWINPWTTKGLDHHMPLRTTTETSEGKIVTTESEITPQYVFALPP